ncbi:MAG: DNA starvation/stationary phase protection protein [Bacteroidetes bacterium]|jgi:starvation-inducible DNA-binding protein|nr:DNA starvation/stationary phase protection protein [Bacteroidota bacterium]
MSQQTVVNEQKDMEINIGISETNRKKIADGLSKVLADTYMLYLKTHNYHWNVTGEHFHSLHEQFEEQYTELAAAIDEIAERIRALGHRAPASFREYNEITTIDEDNVQPKAMEMVRRLAVDNETVLRTARQALPACEEAGDEASIDLITERLHTHSKTAWMLRSHLE